MSTNSTLGHLAAGNDRLEEYRFVILNEWHQTGVALDIADEDTLPWMLPLIRVLDRIEQTAARKMKDNVLECGAPLQSKPLVLLNAPIKALHDAKASQPAILIMALAA